MEKDMTNEQIAIEKLKLLPLDKQQEVLDFIEFLHAKLKGREQEQEQESGSFLAATEDFAGCLEGGPSDLSTNKRYLERLGLE
jgi:Protein of unknown function (DUF2281)